MDPYKKIFRFFWGAAFFQNISAIIVFFVLITDKNFNQVLTFWHILLSKDERIF